MRHADISDRATASGSALWRVGGEGGVFDAGGGLLAAVVNGGCDLFGTSVCKGIGRSCAAVAARDAAASGCGVRRAGTKVIPQRAFGQVPQVVGREMLMNWGVL